MDLKQFPKLQGLVLEYESALTLKDVVKVNHVKYIFLRNS